MVVRIPVHITGTRTLRRVTEPIRYVWKEGSGDHNISVKTAPCYLGAELFHSNTTSLAASLALSNFFKNVTSSMLFRATTEEMSSES